MTKNRQKENRNENAVIEMKTLLFSSVNVSILVAIFYIFVFSIKHYIIFNMKLSFLQRRVV